MISTVYSRISIGVRRTFVDEFVALRTRAREYAPLGRKERNKKKEKRGGIEEALGMFSLYIVLDLRLESVAFRFFSARRDNICTLILSRIHNEARITGRTFERGARRTLLIARPRPRTSMATRNPHRSRRHSIRAKIVSVIFELYEPTIRASTIPSARSDPIWRYDTSS